MGKLKYYLRHYQHKDQDGNPIRYVGPNPQSLVVEPGLVDEPNYREFTQDVEDGSKITLSWKLKDREGQGDGGSGVERGASGSLTFVNKAYLFVFEHLNDSVSAALNAVQVKIEDTECGFFDEWVLKADGMTHCDTDVCRLEMNLRQMDAQFDCLQKTLINDNWQHWFDNTGKQHPRFAYCNEFRPAFVLTVLYMVLAVLGFIVQVIWFILYPIIVILAVVVNIIIGIIRTFSKLLGGNPPDYIDIGDIPTPGEVKEFISDIAVRLTGCGREFPAPLVRDYISNVCGKCGIRVDQYTAPVLFDPASEYYNLTYATQEVKRGVWEDNGHTFFIDDNSPLLTGDMLLDKLKPVFNAEWRVVSGTLYFGRKDGFVSTDWVYDFEGVDRVKIIEGVCFTWNMVKKPAYFRAGYTSDATDMIANDAKRRYNDLVECNNPPNPLLEGEGNKVTTDFSPVRFRGDGIYKDYIEEAFEPLNVIQFVLPIIIPVKAQIRNRLKQYRGVVLTQGWTWLNTKLIIWDGKDMRRARALAPYEYGGSMPPVNPLYNPTGQTYHQVHPDDEQYDDFNEARMRLVNYPMFFEAKFTGNLWDRFHQIDDPRFNPPLNKSFELKIALCCEDLTRLGLNNGPENVAVGRRVKINGGQFYKDGKITEIELSYDPTDKLGRWIRIKGKL